MRAGRVDPVGIGLGGCVLPQLDVGVRLGRMKRRQRRSVQPRGQGRAGGEVDTDAGYGAVPANCAQDRFRRFKIVGGVLERIGRR